MSCTGPKTTPSGDQGYQHTPTGAWLPSMAACLAYDAQWKEQMGLIPSPTEQITVPTEGGGVTAGCLLSYFIPFEPFLNMMRMVRSWLPSKLIRKYYDLSHFLLRNLEVKAL